MISHKPTKIALILAAALFVTGCSLKPKQRNSRFAHTAASNSSNCSCYVCTHGVDTGAQQYADAEYTGGEFTEGVTYSEAPFSEGEVMYPQETYVSPETTQFTESYDTTPRSLYEVPQIEEPVVSENSFKPADNSFKPAENSFQVAPNLFEPPADTSVPLSPPPENPINEVDAESSPSDQMLDLKGLSPSDSNSLDGGSFKSKLMKEEVSNIELPKALEPKTAVPTPAPAKPLVPTPATPTPAVPTPAVAPTPAAKPVPKPISDVLPVEVPKPASSFTPGKAFTPGKTFKPRKKIDLDTSSNTLRQPGEKVVLKANLVERNFAPMPRRVATATVPALQTSFKRNSNENWLRSESHLAVNQPTNRRAYQSTRSAGIEEPQVFRVAQRMPSQQQVETPPKQIPVRLRAIPMSQRMIDGKNVQARFREHSPSPQNFAVPQDTDKLRLKASNVQPMTAAIKSVSMPQTPPVQKAVSLAEPTDFQMTTPGAESPAPDRTAKAIKVYEVATPPWRTK